MPDGEGDVRELDWVVEGAEGAGAKGEWGRGGRGVDVIVVADCVYNPGLAGVLARTIDGVGGGGGEEGGGTVAVVASELRDAEPLEEFLRAWVGCGWTVVRVGGPEDREGGGPGDEVFGREFVLWVGWKNEGKGMDEPET